MQKKGVSYLQFELQPVNYVIPNAKAHIQQQALTCDIEDLENRFDDLRNTEALVEEYLEDEEEDEDEDEEEDEDEDEDEDEEDEDVEEFYSKVNKIQHNFKEAIKTMDSMDGPGKIKEWMEAYTEALGGRDIKGKFTRKWKKILKKKASKMINNNTYDEN